MTTIIDRHGNAHEVLPHIATFNGKHNSCRAKIYLILYSRHQAGITVGLAAPDLHRLTGVRLQYLYDKLSSWYKWRFIKRRAVDPGPGNGRPHFTYTIDERGIKFLKRIPRERQLDYVAEMADHQGKERPSIT